MTLLLGFTFYLKKGLFGTLWYTMVHRNSPTLENPQVGPYRVNPSKRGEIDWVLQGLTGLLPGTSEEQPCQPKENPIHPDSFTWIYILFKKGHFGDFLKYSNIDGWQSIMFAELLEYVYRIVRVSIVLLREAIWQKDLLTFGFFPNGLDPPPLYFWNASRNFLKTLF